MLKNKSNIKLSVFLKVAVLFAVLLLFINIANAQSPEKPQVTKDNGQIVADTLPIKKTGTRPSSFGNQTKDKTISSFTVFGDSKSDLEMGEELFKQKIASCTFFFTFIGYPVGINDITFLHISINVFLDIFDLNSAK